jgi:hypothetical protein
MEDLVRRGRARGIGITLISQRSAVLNKDVLTQAEVLVSLRVTSPQDRKAVDEWVKLHANDDEQRDTFLSSLTSLPVGEAWFWSPGWLDVFLRVKVRKRQTFDSSATPKVGERRIEPKAFAEIDLAELAGHIADTIEKAKAEDPKELRRQIADLQKQLRDHRCPEASVERVEVPLISDQDRQVLRTYIESLDDIARATVTASSNLLELVQARDSVGVGWDKGETERAKREDPPQVIRRQAQAAASGVGDVQLKAGARRIVEALARHYPMRFTKAQIGTMTGFKITGGTFSTYWGQIKRAGLIDESDGLIGASQAGIDFAGVTPEAPTSTAEILDMWRSKLKRGAREILDVLVDSYPNPLSKESVAVEVGMEPTGGTFGTYIGTLRRNGLIESEDGKLRASDSLFIGATS